MFRGEFHLANGLVIPNNITIFGAQSILAAFARNTVPTFFVGLCSAVYEPDLEIGDIEEPTIGVNGYARLPITRDAIGWPSDGLVNNEPYIESLTLVWAAVGGPFDKAVTRMFLTPEESAVNGDIFCLSGALPDEFTIDVDTLEVDRSFKYRIFGR